MNAHWRTLSAALALISAMPLAQAHSASDAYLTLSAAQEPNKSATLQGQWDVALRDLDFAMKLDDDGDGNITWAELRRHQPEIVRYAMPRLRFEAGGKACTVKPTKQLVDNHADGAYAALFFDVDCAARPKGAALKRVAMDYSLFFKIDPSHRAILVMRSGAETSTAVLSPENAKIELKLAP